MSISSNPSPHADVAAQEGLGSHVTLTMYQKPGTDEFAVAVWQESIGIRQPDTIHSVDEPQRSVPDDGTVGSVSRVATWMSREDADALFARVRDSWPGRGTE